MKSDKRKAESKMNTVMIKLQDLYYLRLNDTVARMLSDALDKCRDLENAVMNENNWKK